VTVFSVNYIKKTAYSTAVEQDTYRFPCPKEKNMAKQKRQLLARQIFADDVIILPPNDDRIFKRMLTHPNGKQVLMDRNKINDIIKDKEEIAMAATLLREISKDEHERARLRSRRMYETDKESDRLTSEEIGENRANKKWKIVVKEKDAIIADKEAIIADSKAEIARLKAELGKQQ